VGYSLRRGGYDVRSRGGSFLLGGGPVWSKYEGTYALNRGAANHGLNVLTMNPDWLAPEVVDRLRAELPYERRTCLEKAVIHSRDWGVSGRHAQSAGDCAPFDFEAPAGRRDNLIHWLGTTGVKRFQLALEVKRVVGELRLHLLRDEATGGQVSVVLGEKTVYVDEWRGGAEKRRLHSAPHGARRGPLSAVITLESERVSVQVNGGTVWVSPPVALPPRGALVLQVSENMRGVARADGIRLTFDPQIPQAVAGAALP
jgi:hypothetical protein